MSRVVGIDPGQTTGVCHLYVPDDGPAEILEMEEYEGGVIGLSRKLWLHTLNADTIVCEAFNLDGRTPKPDLAPVEIIGWLKVWGGDRHVIFQTNTQGKHLMTNEVLKRAGYYPKRGEVRGGHGVDSMRHALNYVVKTLKHRPTSEKLFPKEEA